MISVRGSNSIDYAYPPLDSYREAAAGKGFLHNTTGAHVYKLPKGAMLSEPRTGQASVYDDHPQYSYPPSAAGDVPAHAAQDYSQDDDDNLSGIWPAASLGDRAGPSRLPG